HRGISSCIAQPLPLHTAFPYTTLFRSQRLADGYERDIADDELRREGQLRHVARVRSFKNDHARVFANPRVELAVTDVERDHTRRAPLKQHVGETARRGADVEAVAAGRIDVERIERIRQLDPPARDEGLAFRDRELRA